MQSIIFNLLERVPFLKEVSNLFDHVSKNSFCIFFDKFADSLTIKLRSIIENSVKKTIFSTIEDLHSIGRKNNNISDIPKNPYFNTLWSLLSKTTKLKEKQKQVNLDPCSDNLPLDIRSKLDYFDKYNSLIESEIYNKLVNIYPLKELLLEVKSLFYLEGFINFINGTRKPPYFDFKIVKGNISLQQKMRNLFSVGEPNDQLGLQNSCNFFEIKLVLNPTLDLLFPEDSIDKYLLISRILYKAHFVLENLKYRLLLRSKDIKINAFYHRSICFINSFLFSIKNVSFEREFNDLIVKIANVSSYS